MFELAGRGENDPPSSSLRFKKHVGPFRVKSIVLVNILHFPCMNKLLITIIVSPDNMHYIQKRTTTTKHIISRAYKTEELFYCPIADTTSVH